MATSNENSRISRKTKMMVLIGLTATMLGIIFCQRYPCICGKFFQGKTKCNTDQTLTAKPYIDFLKKDTIPSPPIKIRCNEYIVDKSHPAANHYRKNLRALCFELGQTCSCTPGFELWVNPTGNPVDAGTVAANTVLSRPMGMENGGIFPNVVIKVDIPKAPETNERDSISIKEMCHFPDNDSIAIAIIDTGVDTVTDGNNRLNNYGWTKYHNNTRCISNPSTFGLNILNTQREPSDMLGHGTSVNGVVTGESYPNYPDKSLNIKFLNVNVFRKNDTTSTLFDGLCGINYAVHQGAKIVNISWGFDFNPEEDEWRISVEKAIKKVIQEASGTLFVAALGNDNHFISNDHRFYPACLAESTPNLMAIGALNPSGSDIAGFSNFAKAEMMTFCTYGENIFTAFPLYLGGSVNEKLVKGTSYAAPLAARISASYWVRNPGLSSVQVKSHFENYLSTNNISTSRGNLLYRALTDQQIDSLICNLPRL